MFDVVLYYSNGGKSKKVADFFGLPTLNVLDGPCIEKYSKLIIVCPTYGDEELPIEMEDYLLNLESKNKKYAICELGNFFGHEKDFGAAKIINYELEHLGWEKIDSLSLDSVPDIDWESLSLWTKRLLQK